MNGSVRMMRSKKNQVCLAGAVALAIAVSAGGRTASAASSWSTQPSWKSSPAGEARTSKKASSVERDSAPTSPFAPGSNNVALDVGQVFLLGDLGSRYTDNIGTQLHYTYGVSDIFGFDSSFGYSSHADGKFSMVSLLTGLRTNLAWYDKVIPYATFGLGFYKPSYQITPTYSESPLLFGVHLGPGVDLELTKQLYFGASLTFNDVFGGSRVLQNGQVMDMGGTYTTFFLHAGVTF